MNKIRLLLCLAMPVFISANVAGQNIIQQFTSDSVDLQKVVTTIIETHPSVLKAQEAIHTVEASVGLAKAAWYPNIDLGAGYTRIGPVPKITIPNLGSFQMAPENNYNTSVDIHETVYDFKKTDKNIELAASGKDIAETNINLVKQKLTTIAIITYYNLAYLQEAIGIKEKQLGILEQHLDFINRKKETGSATDYEILSTKVRISAAKNQKMDLETALDNQLAALNSLLGFPESTKIKVRNNLVLMPVNTRYDSLIDYAVSHRNEMILAGFREKQAEIKLQSLKIENNPVISAFASGGIKNGYFPDLNKPKANYAAGLGIKVPLYTATRHRNLLMMASSDINSIKQDIEQSRREISTEVYQNAATLESSMRKIEQSELQLEQSEEARRLADLSFKAGTLTNLDLLDSESLEAESRLSLMRAKIDYMINTARLEISIGKPGY
ncbi:MAG: TolC family protein [Bacteroidetes bacterium]|nr:TolC family protein [Bacteroidota bacterium]